MKAVVMAGGEGSRLRPLTSTRAKPLVPVAGRPIMEHILLLLRRHQMRDVVATVQYLGASIRNHFGDGSDLGVSLSYSVEDSPLGTAGSVRLIEDQLKDTFVVISGDALTDIDLTAAVRFHKQRKAMATIVLKPVPNPLEYGVVVVDDGGAVQRFLEKPSWGEVFSDLANTGIYVLEPEVFKYFARNEVTDWSGDVFPQLLKEGEPVFGWVADGYWEDVGSHAAYVKANFDCLEGKVAVDIPGVRRPDESVWVAEDATIEDDVRIDGPAFIGSGSRLRSGVWLNGPVVIGDDVTLDAGTKVSNSIIWNHAYVGEQCRLRGAVLCRAVRVRNQCHLEEGSVVGDEVTIGGGTVVNANVKIWPNKQVEAGAVVRESIIWAGSWKRGLFSAYGLSGIANIEFTPEFAARLGAAVGAMFPRGATLAISRDTSRASRMIKRALISGLLSSGANIADLSALTIPAARHYARHARAAATLHVQGSPLDPRSIDIRIFDSSGLDLDKRTERKLENIFFREDVRRVAHYEMGEISYPGAVTDRYIDDVLSHLDLELVRPARFKVLVDYNHGVAAGLLPRFLDDMNCASIALNASVEESAAEDTDSFRLRLEEIGVIVRATRARLGVLIDSPGERCFFIDETGDVLDHEIAFACIARMALQLRPGSVVGPASSSLRLSLLAERFGGRFVAAKTTPGGVLRAAQHRDTIVASDDAGGYAWPHFGVGFDAAFTVARLLELMAATGLSLARAKLEVPVVGYERATLFCPWEAKGRVMRTVIEQHLKDRVDLTDGVKVFIEDGWVLVVPDPDHPSYHVIASTRTPGSAKELVERYSEVVRSSVLEVRGAEGITERER